MNTHLIASSLIKKTDGEFDVDRFVELAVGFSEYNASVSRFITLAQTLVREYSETGIRKNLSTVITAVFDKLTISVFSGNAEVYSRVRRMLARYLLRFLPANSLLGTVSLLENYVSVADVSRGLLDRLDIENNEPLWYTGTQVILVKKISLIFRANREELYNLFREFTVFEKPAAVDFLLRQTAEYSDRPDISMSFFETKKYLLEHCGGTSTVEILDQYGFDEKIVSVLFDNGLQVERRYLYKVISEREFLSPLLGAQVVASGFANLDFVRRLYSRILSLSVHPDDIAEYTCLIAYGAIMGGMFPATVAELCAPFTEVLSLSGANFDVPEVLLVVHSLPDSGDVEANKLPFDLVWKYCNNDTRVFLISHYSGELLHCGIDMESQVLVMVKAMQYASQEPSVKWFVESNVVRGGLLGDAVSANSELREFDCLVYSGLVSGTLAFDKEIEYLYATNWMLNKKFSVIACMKLDPKRVPTDYVNKLIDSLVTESYSLWDTSKSPEMLYRRKELVLAVELLLEVTGYQFSIDQMFRLLNIRETLV